MGPRSDARPFRVAAVQTVSGGDVAANLAQAGAAGRAGRRRGRGARAAARVLRHPRRARDRQGRAPRERDGDGPQQDVPRAQARAALGSCVVGGCVPIACDDPARVRSACLVYGPDGDARRALRQDPPVRASRTATSATTRRARSSAGDDAVAFDAPCGRVGLSICYDLRFPELYRALGDCALICVPAAFTWTTGTAHWHLLLRARAVENQCYVLAAAQGGVHRRPPHLRPLDAGRSRGARSSPSAPTTGRASSSRGRSSHRQARIGQRGAAPQPCRRTRASRRCR